MFLHTLQCTKKGHYFLQLVSKKWRMLELNLLMIIMSKWILNSPVFHIV
jgi:hypothetical protein